MLLIAGEETHTYGRHMEGKTLSKAVVGLVKPKPGLFLRAGVLKVVERSLSFPGYGGYSADRFTSLR